MTNRPSVLFLCTGNSCRSQIAEGWARQLHGHRLDVYSAGVETHGLNPHAVQVMAENDIDITGQKSQHIDEFAETRLDLVITVCGHAHESCPVFPGNTRVEHVPFDDPPKLAQAAASEQEKLDCYRRVRDEIELFVRDRLPAMLGL